MDPGTAPTRTALSEHGPGPEDSGRSLPPNWPLVVEERPRRRLYLRALLTCLGWAALVLAAAVEANLPTNSLWNLPGGAGLATFGILLFRLARALAPPDAEPGLRPVPYFLALSSGCVLLVGSVTSATAPVHPDDPIFLSPSAACGSAVMTRSLGPLPGTQLEKELGDYTGPAALATDCNPARQSAQAGAIFLALLGAFVMVKLLGSRRRDTKDRDTKGTAATVLVPGNPHQTAPGSNAARKALLGVAVVIVFTGGLLTLRTRDDMASATRNDREEAAWLAQYAGHIMPMLRTMNDNIVPSVIHHDFAGILLNCQRALQQSEALAQSVARLPKFLPPEVRPAMDLFDGDVHVALKECTEAATEKDAHALERAGRKFTDAGGASEKLFQTLAPV